MVDRVCCCAAAVLLLRRLCYAAAAAAAVLLLSCCCAAAVVTYGYLFSVFLKKYAVLRDASRSFIFFGTRLFVFFGHLMNFKNDASDMEASNAISAIRPSQTQSK